MSAPTFPGASWWGHSPNSSLRLERVQYFVVHHAATTASVSSLIDRFMNPNDRQVSPNWLIGADGSISEIVPPDNYRAWTTGSFDHRAVTVETQNTSGEPNWGISEASHVAIARLVSWASARYGFPIDREHVIGHREVPGQSTACPGPSMDLDKIVRLARELNSGGNASPTIRPEDDDEEVVMLKVKAGNGTHMCALSIGTFRHLIGTDPVDWIKNVARADDAWVDVDLENLPALLRTYGCDLKIWDVRNGSFVVLDPMDGSVKPGNAWTALGALRSTLSNVEVTSKQTEAYLKKL